MKTPTIANRSGARRMSTGAQGVGERTKTLQIRNVLVPVDFSAPSLEAMKLAVPWAKRFGAQLHMIHAFEPNYSGEHSSVGFPRIRTGSGSSHSEANERSSPNVCDRGAPWKHALLEGTAL